MNKQLLLAAPFILALGLGGGYWLGKHQKQESKIQPAAVKQPLFYRNPMNPAVTSPVPAKDSTGMDYVPVYPDESHPQERKILFYRSPMNPAITSPVPA
ncbi:MAG: efflux RND transporter periplasmic adaptor subunit, partial [Methylosarcina sp.]